ncbi:hypothetical protein K4K51_007377 [Colletotrichum sp. SAR 10_75]|nr:hypothetical protein K4K51_007377 [Colletotrichum sp. SAR 10_75]
MVYTNIRNAAGLVNRPDRGSSNTRHPSPQRTNDENRALTEKHAAVLNSSNWRKPLKPHENNTECIRVSKSRKTSGIGTDFNMADPATHLRKPVSGVDPLLIATDPVFGGNAAVVPQEIFTLEKELGAKKKKGATPLVMDLVIHDCDDPDCDNGVFNNAEIRRIKSATRFKSQPRDGGILDFEKQLRGAKITPRKLSMVDLTNPCNYDQDNIFSGKDHFKKLQAECQVKKTAIIQDPAVVTVGDKNSDEDAIKEIRFNEMLRKLKSSSIPEYHPVAVVKDSPKDRPRQDSGDSGVDMRSPIKRSLNPLAKEFAAFSSKENPVVAEKRGSETSMNIPLSVLEQIVGQSDQFKPFEEGGGQQISNEAILNTIQKFGLGSAAQQKVTSPFSFESLAMKPALQPSPFPLKPRIPDAMAQQKYEEYIEWKKANDPKYALECKNRQARRAIRNNPVPA